MSQKNEKPSQALLYSDHKRPVSRREFLSQGLLAFSATSFVPGLSRLWESQAFADGCSQMATGGNFIPFLVFDCAGGAALPANFLVGKSGGPEDLLAKYDRLGWDPKASGAVDKSFGLPMATTASQLRKGIFDTTSPEARANLRMGSICHTAQDDTSSNILSAISLVVRAGYRGTKMSRPTGSKNSNSGGNSQAVLQDPAMKPLFLNSVDSLKDSVVFGGGSFTGIASGALKKMLEVASRLNAEQLKDFEKSQNGKKLSELATCASKENLGLFNANATIDPRTVADYQQIYGINANTQANQQAAVFATLTMNALNLNTGPAVMTFGGCDYHNNTQATGDAKDLEIGSFIGRAVEAAHRAKTPLFFQILTDGGVNNQPGTRIWTSDAGERCMTVVGYYDPKGAPQQKRVQIGNYTDGQVADKTTVVGNSPFKAGCAVFANYLSLVVKPEDFEKEFNRVVPAGTFKDMKEVESLLVFG